jgi:hypothetical protein
MYFNNGKGVATVLPLLFFSLILSNHVYADKIKVAEETEVTFSALPEQCVTLREGRNCFATVELHWQSSTKQSFCLYQEGKSRQFGCWENNNKLHIKIEFESNKSIKYQLRTVKSNKIIAETQVEVSWQHKNTSRKRRWRLF